MTKEDLDIDVNISNKNKKIKIIFATCFSLICIVIIGFWVMKSNYFIIKNIKVENNLFVTKDEISILSELKGNNIFLMDKTKIGKKISLNPYIEKIIIKRKLPSTVIIEVVEKKIKGIVRFKNGFINIDENGKMVQIVNQFPNGKIPLILGFKVDNYVPNEYLIKNDTLKFNALKAVLTTSNYKESKYYFYSIDIEDPYNIVYITNEKRIVKIGDWTNIEYKIAYTISILKNKSIMGLKGFIQIQPDGSAVFKKH